MVYRIGLVLLLLAGADLFDVLKNGNSARLFGIMLHVKQDLSHCRILQKEQFRTKNKVRERKEA